jgi:hypothetical protein
MTDDTATTRRQLVDAIDARLCALDPTRAPADERTKQAAADWVAAAPPMTAAQRRIVARAFRSSRYWDRLRAAP